MAKRGRPRLKLTDERRTTILESLEDGRSYRSISKMISVSEYAIRRWRKENDDFSQACQEAREVGQKKLTEMAEEGLFDLLAKRDPVTIRWFLEHRHPDKYASKRILDQTHGQQSPFEIIIEAIDEEDDSADN